MRMANFALAVSGMTGNVVPVGMSVVMIVAATTCVAVRVGMTMFMLFMLVATTTCVTVCVGMTVFMFFMLVAATACIAMCMGVLMGMTMFMLFMVMFMLMGMSAAAIVAMYVLTCALMGMSTAAISTMLAFMIVIVIMVMLILITVRMLRHMSHRLMIMVLATMAAGASFRMLAVIFYAIDATINMLISSYIISTITDIFEIFLHYIYHLSA